MEARQAPAGYSDLDEGLERLEIEGLLIRTKEPVDKDQEMHPFVRRQFCGGIKEKDPKAFLFEKPVDAEGKVYQDVRRVHDLARHYSYVTDATVAGVSYISAPPLPSGSASAARIAREGKLSGAVLWQRRVQGAIPTPSATNLGQASMDAVRTILRDLFAG
jgi:3-polyprenyl-4-hydroxybenzoate decarboxylase